MQIIEQHGYRIEFHRGGVKNINLRVYPEEQRIRVSAPRRMPMRIVEGFISSKKKWIAERLQKGEELRRQKEKEWTEGEVIRFRGRDHAIRFSKEGECLKEGFDHKEGLLHLKPGRDATGYEQTVDRIYRRYLNRRIPEIIDEYSGPMNVQVREFGIRKMKTRWGSCNIRAGRIWLNLSLASYSDRTLEYVVVHEMAHLLEKYHNRRFYGFLDSYFPEWKDVEKELNGRRRFCI